jgi:hypothetical protein
MGCSRYCVNVSMDARREPADRRLLGGQGERLPGFGSERDDRAAAVCGVADQHGLGCGYLMQAPPLSPE